MKWSEISVHTTQEALEAVANILHEAGASGVVIEDPNDLSQTWDDHYGEIYELNPADFPEEGVIVKAYLPVNSFIGETIESIKEAINNLLLYDIDLGRGTVNVTEINEDEWATSWKKYYHPVRITDRIVITPTWEDYTPESDSEIIIELDPGMAFGTGTHPTTVMCIEAIEKHLPKEAEVIDVGTGTGVLSIAAAKLGAKHVLGLDLDEMAVRIAKQNAKLNKVSDIISVKQNNLLDGIEGPADLIVANILAEVILRFVDDAYAVLREKGKFIVSGVIHAKEDSVREALEDVGFLVVDRLQIEDWIALVAEKAVESCRDIS